MSMFIANYERPLLKTIEDLCSIGPRVFDLIMQLQSEFDHNQLSTSSAFRKTAYLSLSSQMSGIQHANEPEESV